MCGESVDTFPEHAWIMTLEGWKLFRAWKHEQHLRDLECYRADITIPIFRKWSGYGVCEVIENKVQLTTFTNDTQDDSEWRTNSWTVPGLRETHQNTACGYHRSLVVDRKYGFLSQQRC